MQLAEPAGGHAIRNHARRAIGMQPFRREAGVRGKAIEVHAAHLEPRHHLLHHTLHIKKIKGAAGMQRAFLRQRAHRSESQRRTLVHLFGGAAEDRAQLKQPHIANVAIQVARNHGQHAGHKRRAQHACLFAERIAKRNHQRRAAAQSVRPPPRSRRCWQSPHEIRRPATCRAPRLPSPPTAAPARLRRIRAACWQSGCNRKRARPLR